MKKDNYLDDLIEWQQHQYQKGYYTGGKMPPVVKYSHLNDKYSGKIIFSETLVLFCGMCVILAAFVTLVWGTDSDNVYLIILSALLGICGIGTLTMKLTGRRHAKNSNTRRR